MWTMINNLRPYNCYHSHSYSKFSIFSWWTVLFCTENSILKIAKNFIVGISISQKASVKFFLVAPLIDPSNKFYSYFLNRILGLKKHRYCPLISTAKSIYSHFNPISNLCLFLIIGCFSNVLGTFF
jgi:hypothetical protein